MKVKITHIPKNSESKKAFWGAIIGAVAGEAKEKGKQDTKNLVNNFQESAAPILMTSAMGQQEADRLNNLYLSGGVQNMANLQSPQAPLPGQQIQPLQQPYNPNNNRYMKNGGEMYGQGGELITGEGGSTELKSFNPYDQGTFQFNGKKHSVGGIDINFRGENAEVEGGETAFKDQEGNLKIMGNLVNPLTGKKYKNDLKAIANKEKKAQKLVDKGAVLLNTASPEDPFEQLAFNAGKAMTMGGLIKQKELSQAKQHLGDMQEAHLEIAMEKKKAPEKLFKDGGTVYAEDGTTLAPEGDPIYEAMVRKAAEKYGVKPETIIRLIEQESSFNPLAVSNTGAKGIMQFMPGTAKQYGIQNILTSKKPEDVEKVIEAGVKHFSSLLKSNNNDEILALAAYNSGQGTVNDFRKSAKKSKTEYTGQDLLNRMEWKREHQPSNKPNLAQNQTYDYIKNIYAPVVPAEEFRNKYYTPHPTDGMFNGTYKVPKVDFTPNVSPIQTVQGDGTPVDLHQPPPLNKPSNARGLNPSQLLGEGYAIATNQEEPVKAQLYTPELYNPYQVSFQDRLNQNQSTFNSVEKQLAYDPTSLSTLAGQKYSADSGVLADEFRTNQQIANDITNKNVSLLNEAKFKNLGILDQQYTRQSQAKSNTKRVNQEALNSISSKLLQKEASNNMLKVYENLYPDYAFNKKTGKAEYYGPDAASQIDWSGVQPVGNQGDKSKVVTKSGNTTTTQYYEDPIEQALKANKLEQARLNQFAPKPISLTKLFKNRWHN